MSEFDYPYLESLVQRVNRDPARSYTELFTATYQTQYRLIRSFISDLDTAQDILAEAYIQTFSNLSRFQSAYQFLPCLSQIVFRLCMEHVPCDHTMYLLMDFVESLPVKMKHVFVMRSFHHMNYSAISAALDWSYFTVLANALQAKHKYQNFCHAHSFSFSSSAFSSDAIPMESAQAEKLLSYILEQCGCSKPVVSIALLESWTNYRKPGSPGIRRAILASIVLLALFPLCFIPPRIFLSRTQIFDTAAATYQVELYSIFPLSSVSCTLNGEPLTLTKIKRNVYHCTIKDNGALVFKADSLNGQSQKKELQVNQLDKKAPILLSCQTQDEITLLVVEDTHSGIDFEHITGADVLSYDEASGLLKVQTPSEPTRLQIPDRAGNVLTISL